MELDEFESEYPPSKRGPPKKKNISKAGGGLKARLGKNGRLMSESIRVDELESNCKTWSNCSCVCVENDEL